MTLAEYLRNYDLTDEEFAKRLRIATSPFAVKKWRYGERTPRLPMLLEIEQATGGDVTPSDFMFPAAPPAGDGAGGAGSASPPAAEEAA